MVFNCFCFVFSMIFDMLSLQYWFRTHGIQDPRLFSEETLAQIHPFLITAYVRIGLCPGGLQLSRTSSEMAFGPVRNSANIRQQHKSKICNKKWDFDSVAGSEWFVCDFEHFFDIFWNLSIIQTIFKNHQKVMFLARMEVGILLFVSKPSVMIPQESIFDPWRPIWLQFSDFLVFVFCQKCPLQKLLPLP